MSVFLILHQFETTNELLQLRQYIGKFQNLQKALISSGFSQPVVLIHLRVSESSMLLSNGLTSSGQNWPNENSSIRWVKLRTVIKTNASVSYILFAHKILKTYCHDQCELCWLKKMKLCQLAEHYSRASSKKKTYHIHDHPM